MYVDKILGVYRRVPARMITRNNPIRRRRRTTYAVRTHTGMRPVIAEPSRKQRIASSKATAVVTARNYVCEHADVPICLRFIALPLVRTV